MNDKVNKIMQKVIDFTRVSNIYSVHALYGDEKAVQKIRSAENDLREAIEIALRETKQGE